MLLKKYHAIILFTSILVMLLLLIGLHLLGVNVGLGWLTTNSSDTNAKSSSAAALNSSASNRLLASQSADPLAYRHPIVYDKQTGKQISDVISGPSDQNSRFQLGTNEYPLDHYHMLQLRQQQQQQQQQQQLQQQHNPFSDFFPGLSQHRGHFMHHPQIPTPPPISNQPLPMPPSPLMTPNKVPMPLTTPVPHSPSSLEAPRISDSIDLSPTPNPTDSLGSASDHFAVNPNGGSKTNSTDRMQTYTPPIFSRNQIDDSEPVRSNEPVTTYNDDVDGSTSRARSGQPKQPVNLLGDPLQQQRHRDQMLDRQFLFSNRPIPQPDYPRSEVDRYPQPVVNQRQAVADPGYAIQRLPQHQMIPSRLSGSNPPYVHPTPFESNRIDDSSGIHNQPNHYGMPANSRILPSNQGTSVNAVPYNHQPSNAFNMKNQATSPSVTTNGLQAPACASNLNSSSISICHEDSEYPVKEIMKALEMYSSSSPDQRSIEQLLPQSLIWLHLSQQQQQNSRSNSGQSPIRPPLTLDPLQQVLGGPHLKEPFTSGNFASLCRSSVFMSQPRRAKNVLGEWKIIVNLPGHKYRGTAISQMVRVEECTRPMNECTQPSSQASNNALSGKSKCLQQYESQRLLSWSQQQGLHIDVFRIPISCSCHMIRNRV